MTRFKSGLIQFGQIVAGVVFFSSTFVSGTALTSTASSASTPIPTCSSSQLEVAAAWGNVAAGNIGVPFLVANVSKAACSLEGYPKLTFIPSSYMKKAISVSNGGGMIFVAVKPRLVVIKARAVASFGMDFVDALNQQYPHGAACTVQDVYVTLPVRLTSFPTNFETSVNFNFCYSGFGVDVTSIEAGPLPKE
jgi:hypothetical protein